MTVCPPRGSNTALNHVLERVNNENFTEEKREELLDLAAKTFLVNPNKKYVSAIIDLVNVHNIRGLYEGHISMPEVDNGKYTFAIKSSQLEGSFSTPGFGMRNYTGDFYTRAKRTHYQHFHHYQLDVPSIASFVRSGNFAINVETLDDQEEWSYSRQEKRLELKAGKLNFSEARNFCKGLGGDLASIQSSEKQQKVSDEIKDSRQPYVIAGGFLNESGRFGARGWNWADGSSWVFFNWEVGEQENFQEDKGCLFLNRLSGQWKKDSCSKKATFLCEVEPSKWTGNRTFVNASLTNSRGPFNLWWKHIPDDKNRSQSPGLRLSWHIENGTFPDSKELVGFGLSGQIKTPGLGAPTPQGYKNENHTYYASVNLPGNVQDMIGNDTLLVDIDINMPGTGKVQFWTGAQSYHFYATKKSWFAAEAFCKSKNGHLASVVTLADKEKVDAVAKGMYDYDSVWLGGRQKDGKWTWSDGEPWTIEFWNGKPAYYYHCLATYGNNYYYAVSCDYDTRSFVC